MFAFVLATSLTINATGSFGANVSLRTVAVVCVVIDSPCAFVTVCVAGIVSTVVVAEVDAVDAVEVDAVVAFFDVDDVASASFYF